MLYADFNASNLDVRSGNVAMACIQGGRDSYVWLNIGEGISLSILSAGL